MRPSIDLSGRHRTANPGTFASMAKLFGVVPLSAMTDVAVALYWIPLGAGNHSVRLNGIVYEAALATIQRRTRCHLYHSALEVRLPSGHYWVEMTPVPNAMGEQRGVVAEGSVGMRWLGRLRLFRYEVRRWRDGAIPDLAFAVDSPVHITSDVGVARRVFDALPRVPSLVWGRDELSTGDMWSCNSVTSWALASAGIDMAAIRLPPHGRAPGWDAGIAAALHAPTLPRRASDSVASA